MRTRVIRNEHPAGGAAARNTGLRAASAEIVAFLDDDDEWLPAKMEIQLAWLREHPGASLVTCGHLRCEVVMSISKSLLKTSSNVTISTTTSSVPSRTW